MAEASVTYKLSPSEARRVRDSLATRKEDAHEHARELEGERAYQLARECKQEALELGLILEKI